jgi:hypothetical protein
MLSMIRREAYPTAALAVLVWAFAANAQIPAKQWESTLESPGQDYELRGAAMAMDADGVWAAVAARPRGRLGGAEQVLMTMITGARGVARPLIDLASDNRIALPPARHAIRGMAAAGDAQVLTGLSHRAGGMTLAILDGKSGEIAQARTLAFQSGQPEIARFAPLTGGRTLVIGTLGTRPFLSEVSAAGGIVWERVLAQDHVNLDAAAATSDGGAVISGRVGLDPEATRVWVAKVSQRGELERHAEFTGWVGNVAQGVDGGFLLVTTERGRDAQVTLRGLSPNLDQRWTSAMPAGQPSTPSYRVAPVPSGGFIVAGVKDRGLWVSRIDAAGKTVWTEARVPTPPQVEAAINVELLSQRDVFIVVYTLFAVDGKEQRQLVRAIRFSA